MRLLQRLVKSGIISSQKGKGGGFFFEPNREPLLLKEVILLVEGNKVFTSCGFGLGQCNDDNPCAIHDQFIKVRASLESVFSENTIQDLALKNQISHRAKALKLLVDFLKGM